MILLIKNLLWLFAILVSCCVKIVDGLCGFSVLLFAAASPFFWLLLQVYLSRDEPWPPRV